MRFFRPASVILAAVMLAAAPARGEILDIQSETTDAGLRILFVFDSQPGDASVSVSGSEAQATIAGAHGAGRLLRPSSGGLRQVSVADRPLGLSIGALADRPILGAEATVFRNAVLFELTLSPGAAPEDPQGDGAPLLAGAASEAAAQDAAMQQAQNELAIAALASGDPLADAALAEAIAAASPPLPADLPPAPDVAATPPEAAPETDIAEAAPAETPAGPVVLAPEPAPEPQAPQAAEIAPPVLPDMPEWADDPEAYRMAEVALPRSDAPPGAAAELLAAQLDRVTCETAAAQVAADPWALDALYNHGACLARDGQSDRAREVFERLETFDPSSPRALVALGVLRQDAGDRGGAQTYYSRAMANNAEDGLAVLVRMLGEL